MNMNVIDDILKAKLKHIEILMKEPKKMTNQIQREYT
jgi:hypothetical protein